MMLSSAHFFSNPHWMPVSSHSFIKYLSRPYEVCCLTAPNKRVQFIDLLKNTRPAGRAWRVTLFTKTLRTKQWRAGSMAETSFNAVYCCCRTDKGCCMFQGVVGESQGKPQHYCLLLTYDLCRGVCCFIRRMSEAIAVWFPSSGGAGGFTFCGGQLPSCCCNAKCKSRTYFRNLSCF